MKKPDQPKPCGNLNCPVCGGGMQIPQILRVLIASVEEPQIWRAGKNGTFIPVWVEDKPDK